LNNQPAATSTEPRSPLHQPENGSDGKRLSLETKGSSKLKNLAKRTIESTPTKVGA